MSHIIAEFESRLKRLADWPDKIIITELTDYLSNHVSVANHLADILVATIIDPNTPKSFKIPLFYLVDSVLKLVHGVYAELFSSHIAEVFRRSFEEVNFISYLDSTLLIYNDAFLRCESITVTFYLFFAAQSER